MESHKGFFVAHMTGGKILTMNEDVYTLGVPKAIEYINSLEPKRQFLQ